MNDREIRARARAGKLPWREIQRRGVEDDYITTGPVQGPPDLKDAICPCGQQGIPYSDCPFCVSCCAHDAVISKPRSVRSFHGSVTIFTATCQCIERPGGLS